MTPVAPRNLIDVSYVTRINHESHFWWPAQYLVRRAIWEVGVSLVTFAAHKRLHNFRRVKQRLSAFLARNKTEPFETPPSTVSRSIPFACGLDDQDSFNGSVTIHEPEQFSHWPSNNSVTC